MANPIQTQPGQSSPEHSTEYITLREYFESCIKSTSSLLKAEIEAERDNSEARFDGIEKATELARQSMEKRLDSMNEFRAALKDAGTLYLTKSEFTVWQSRVDADIRTILQAMAKIEGKASQSDLNRNTIGMVIGIVISIISLVWGIIK